MYPPRDSSFVGLGAFRVVGLLLAPVMAFAAAPAAPVEVIAASGLAVPDQPGVMFGRQLAIPAINNAGQVVFYGSGGSGYHVFEGTSWQDLATVIQNFPPPSGAGALGFEATTPALTDGGAFASRYALFGQPGQSLVYRGPGGAAPTYAVVDSGQLTTFPLSFHSGLALNDSGTLLFVRPPLGSQTPATSILNFTPAGGIGTFVSAGQPVAGAPGLTMQTFSSPLLNQAGDVLFRATLADAGGGSAGAGLFTGQSASSLTPIVRIGDAAPAAGAGATFVDFAALNTSLNSAGQAVFAATVTDPTNPGSNRGAVYRYTPGTGLELVARQGQTLPLAGGFFRGPLDAPMLMSSGGVAVRDSSRIYTGTSAGDFRAIGGEGVVAPPELPAGTAYSLPSPSVFANNAGQVVFLAEIAGAPGATNMALFAWDPSAGLHMVLREGDSIEVAPGDVRTLLGYNAPHNATSLPGFDTGLPFPDGGLNRAFNDRGELALLAYLTSPDSSQPYSSAVITVQVPEPGVLAWLGAAAGLALARRRR